MEIVIIGLNFTLLLLALGYKACYIYRWSGEQNILVFNSRDDQHSSTPKVYARWHSEFPSADWQSATAAGPSPGYRPRPRTEYTWARRLVAVSGCHGQPAQQAARRSPIGRRRRTRDVSAGDGQSAAACRVTRPCIDDGGAVTVTRIWYIRPASSTGLPHHQIVLVITWWPRTWQCPSYSDWIHAWLNPIVTAAQLVTTSSPDRQPVIMNLIHSPG